MILVLGAGESGIGAARLAAKLGLPVFVSDAGHISPDYRQELIDAEIDFEEGGHEIAMDLFPDKLVKSPGIPDTAPVIQHFIERGIRPESEIEFAWNYCNGKVIAITGSNGKTTTTRLCTHLLQEGGLDVIQAGNVGHSFARALSEGTHSCYVLELSSFQLDGIAHFRPDIAILLNVTPDHLDRYAYSMERYTASKFRIAMNQRPEDAFIVYAGDPVIRDYLAKHPQKGRLQPIQPELDPHGVVRINGEPVANLSETCLRGRHNAVNAACAVIAARMCGLSDAVIHSALNSFVNDPHRLEYLGQHKGIDFINDSKATNVDSVYWALDAMTKPVIWIAGGLDKGNDYESIQTLVRNKVAALVCLGADNAKLVNAFKGTVDRIAETDEMSKAVAAAMEFAQPGEVILLSPACASFDLFSNYMDRGEQFRREFLKLNNPNATL
ncbi:MAG: UDP-N-acetylmuramoyl-L-alanine--D-glutamate ligase [Saprospiraceae bacterium]|nr:UDP-N-acetylmuramoyl-L-alanine--D-glutamate ligase [Saprospiraceae bacterium]